MQQPSIAVARDQFQRHALRFAEDRQQRRPTATPALRQLIEPDFDKPKYIYRAKNGYYLNRNAKVSIEQ